MVARFPACDKRRLRQVLAVGTAEDIEADVAEHLEACASCRRDLELLAGGAAWWSEVRSFLTPLDPDSGSDLPSRVETTQRGDAQENTHDSQLFAGWRKQLGFLAPTESAGSLGRLGPYEITDVIGRGGMGIVLRAHDPALNRHVAIKVLAAEWAHNATARRRFAREAQAAAAVVHDHVVPIHSVDASGDVPYLVMAHIPGRSLQQRIDRAGPLEIREILRIGMQTAAGLAAAHAQGLVHRDIKPANILLENSVERVRITDFGLARAVDDVSQTQSGILAGTPQYMSPEQAAGEAVDHRTDLFSLGSVLYAMCTGRSPFRAETTVAVIRRICDGKARPVREVNPDIPEWFAEIIDKLHAQQPQDRFQTAGEVAELLERHLAHLQQPTVVPQPGRLRPVANRESSVPVWGRRRLMIGWIALGLCVAAAVASRSFFFPSASDDSSAGAASREPASATHNIDSGAPVEASRSAIPRSATSSSVALEEITHTGLEPGPIEAEFESLKNALQGLEMSLYPRLPMTSPDQRASRLTDLDRRLNLLEQEMLRSPVLERRQR